eukprot:5270348-Prymnesium_polylepis.1
MGRVVSGDLHEKYTHVSFIKSDRSKPPDTMSARQPVKPVITGAEEPAMVTHGITLSNPALAWLILITMHCDYLK